MALAFGRGRTTYVLPCELMSGGEGSLGACLRSVLEGKDAVKVIMGPGQ